MQDNVPQARIYKVWNIPGYRQRDFTLLDMAADVLGGGKNSRLYKRLVYTDRTATAVTAVHRPVRDRLAVADHRHGKAGRRSGRRSRRRSTRSWRGSSPRARRPRSSSASAPLTTRTSRAASSASTASAASRRSSPRARCTAARRISTRRGSTGSRARRPPTCRAPRSAGCRTACSCSTSSPCPRTRPWRAPSIAARCPTPGAPPSLKLPAPARAKLSNGLEIVVVERHSAPVVDFTLIADAGFAADAPAKPGTARLTMLMLQEGTKTRTSPEIADRVGVARRAARAWVRRSIARSST